MRYAVVGATSSGQPVSAYRDVLDTTINYGAHEKFVTKWLDKIDAEEKQAAQTGEAASTPAPAAGGQTAEA